MASTYIDSATQVTNAAVAPTARSVHRVVMRLSSSTRPPVIAGRRRWNGSASGPDGSGGLRLQSQQPFQTVDHAALAVVGLVELLEDVQALAHRTDGADAQLSRT